MAAANIHGTIGKDHFITHLNSENHQWVADEPLDKEGSDKGPNPYELLLSSLAACTLITLRSYIDVKKWEVERITAELQLEVEDEGGIRKSSIQRKVTFSGSLPEDVQKRLLTVAERCPVHRVLTGEIQIETETRFG